MLNKHTNKNMQENDKDQIQESGDIWGGNRMELKGVQGMFKFAEVKIL